MPCRTGSDPRLKLALALVCQLCGRGKHGLSPGQKFFPAHGVCADIFPSWLVDGKADLRNIVDAIEQVEGAQRIAGKLAVLLRRHQDAEPVLVVNDVEKPVRYDDAVPGAEAALDPHIAGIVEPLLHKHQRVGAAFPGLCHFLHYEGAVPLGTVLHLLGVVGQVLRGVLHPAAEGFFHLIGAQLMAVRSRPGHIRWACPHTPRRAVPMAGS